MPPSAPGSTASRHDARRSGSGSRCQRSATTTSRRTPRTPGSVACGRRGAELDHDLGAVGLRPTRSRSAPVRPRGRRSGRRDPEMRFGDDRPAQHLRPDMVDPGELHGPSADHDRAARARTPDRPADRSRRGRGRPPGGAAIRTAPSLAAGIATPSVGVSGSSNGQFRCTGPGRVGGHRLERFAGGLAPPCLLPWRRRARGGRGGPDVLPEEAGCTIVWFAPVPRTLGGRSAVRSDQRHPRLRCLDDRGKELGRRRAARGRHDHRLAASPSRGRARRRRSIARRGGRAPAHEDRARGRARGASNGIPARDDACATPPSTKPSTSAAAHASEMSACSMPSVPQAVRAEDQPERQQEAGRRMDRRRPAQDGDQLATARRADGLHRADRRDPAGEPEQPPLREADPLVDDEGQHAERRSSRTRRPRTRDTACACAGRPDAPPASASPRPRRSGCP